MESLGPEGCRGSDRSARSGCQRVHVGDVVFGHTGFSYTKPDVQYLKELVNASKFTPVGKACSADAPLSTRLNLPHEWRGPE